MSSMAKSTYLPLEMVRSRGYETQQFLATAWKNSLKDAEKTSLEAFRRHRVKSAGEWGMQTTFVDRYPAFSSKGADALYAEKEARLDFAKSMIVKQLSKDFEVQKAQGVTTALGFNFIDLRGPAFFIVPINVPFRNSLARVGRQNDGFGTQAIWKASTNLGQNYGGVSEGQRNSYRTPNQITYTASYKQIGGESEVSTSAEWASEGYSSQLGDEHIRGLLGLFLSEEAMNLHGNAGANYAGANGAGYQLGTPATPTVTTNSGTTTSFSGATSVSVCCVYLTAMGNPVNNQYGYLTNLVPNANTVAGGLVASYTRTNADLSQDVIPGGTSQVSAMSAVVTANTTVSVTATAWKGTAFPKGVFGYAWYVNTTDASNPSYANAKLAAITQFPTYTITAQPVGTQTAAAFIAAGGSADNSASNLDYTGLIGYAAGTAGAYWNDLAGATFTPTNGGKIVEIETMLQTMYQTYQTGINAFWVSQDVAESIDIAVRHGGTGGQPFQFIVTRDGQNNVAGGYVVSTYQSRYAAANPLGANQIPIMIHPMMPAGTLFADISELPAGYETSRLPYLRAMLVRQDYHSYEWPMTTRTWTFGTYAEQCLQHFMPWACGIITGVGISTS